MEYRCVCAHTCTMWRYLLPSWLVQRGQFTITHGFDGVLLGVVAAGFSPAHSLAEGLWQVCP